MATKEYTLAEIRRKKNITQSEMAKKLNISVSAYNMYENGLRKIPNEIVEKIVKILNISDEVKKTIFMPRTFAIRKTKQNTA